MLNPKAPAQYGTAGQHVILDPETGKWRGIKLFGALENFHRATGARQK